LSLAFESLGRDYYTRLGGQLAEFRRILGAVLIQDMRSAMDTVISAI
jgi:capsular polysaccharide transport system permease protein